jgi:histidinol-phosphate aminotransferase
MNGRGATDEQSPKVQEHSRAPRELNESLRALLRPELADLRAYVPEGSLAEDTVKLDANEAPPSSSPVIRETIARAIARVAMERYPDARATELREAIAERTGASPDDLLFGTGSDEVIALLLNALARPREKLPQAVVLAPTPTFVMYRVTARAHGLKSVEVPLDASWNLDAATTVRGIEALRPNVVFIASPNNPTGNRMTEASLAQVIEAADDALVVLDEAYIDYAGGSLRAWRARYPNLAILRTLSKVGLAALRVGWLEADAALVRELDKGRQPFNVSATSQAAAAAVVREGWSAVEEDVARVVSERTRVSGELARISGLTVTPSDANFVWVRTLQPAKDVVESLASRGVRVRSFHAAGGRLANQMRVTIGAAKDNDRFLDAIREVTA